MYQGKCDTSSPEGSLMTLLHSLYYVPYPGPEGRVGGGRLSSFEGEAIVHYGSHAPEVGLAATTRSGMIASL